MRAAPLLVAWHNDNSPIYSAHFETHGKNRLATAGGDNNIRLWKVDSTGDERKVTYLSTLVKHTQAVNVVRWCPRGELLASAGDDGNVLLWVPSESQSHSVSFGEDGLEEKETWRVKHMCRSMGSEIYDLAWSPDGVFFITGSMDNIARIYNAQTGQIVRQIAEHNHYVQGVAWDPLNEFVATQSSDRSVHIYTLKTKDGQFSLAQHAKFTKMDLPARRISTSSPAPPDFPGRAQFVGDNASLAVGSPAPSAPGTPASLPVPMNPPAISHSRRSSFGSSPSIRRSVSPAPSLPLPAVMPVSPNISAGGLSVRNASIYANETLTSFFRRLTFTPDGSLLLTPAGQYRTAQPASAEAGKQSDEIINTVYIYTRAGLNKPPVAHLPGHKKPSVAVRCSPVLYTLRTATVSTKDITIDTASSEAEIPALPEPALASKTSGSFSTMEPPPITGAPSPSSIPPVPTAKPAEPEVSSSSAGPSPAFALPYRVVYAVATQDAVLVYDTQQLTPLCVVSNLHFATFTDLTWSTDGLTLLMSSSDGFCSALTFSPGELGQVYLSPVTSQHRPSINTTSLNSAQSTPVPTPTTTTTTLPSLPKQHSGTGFIASPAPSSGITGIRPASPTRSNSASSIATQSSFAHSTVPGVVMNNPTPSMGSMPSVAAAQSAPVGGPMPLTTPPMTPMHVSGHRRSSSREVTGMGVAVLGKREEMENGKDMAEEREAKRRRIAPTLVQPEGQGGVG